MCALYSPAFLPYCISSSVAATAVGPPGGGARLGMLRRAGVRARDGGQWQQQAVRKEHVPHVAGPEWAAREPAKAARPAVPVLHDQLRNRSRDAILLRPPAVRWKPLGSRQVFGTAAV